MLFDRLGRVGQGDVDLSVAICRRLTVVLAVRGVRGRGQGSDNRVHIELGMWRDREDKSRKRADNGHKGMVITTGKD